MPDSIESLDNFKRMVTEIVEQDLKEGALFCARRFAFASNGAKCPMKRASLRHPEWDKLSVVNAAAQYLKVSKATIWSFIGAFDLLDRTVTFINEEGSVRTASISDEMRSFALELRAKIGDKLYEQASC